MERVDALHRLAVLKGWQSGQWPEICEYRDKLAVALKERGVDLAQYLMTVGKGDEPNATYYLLEVVPSHDEPDPGWVRCWNRCANDLTNDVDAQADRIADEVSGL